MSEESKMLELDKEFVESIHNNIQYWGINANGDRLRFDGVVFSLLCEIDGVAEGSGLMLSYNKGDTREQRNEVDIYEYRDLFYPMMKDIDKMVGGNLYEEFKGEEFSNYNG